MPAYTALKPIRQLPSCIIIYMQALGFWREFKACTNIIIAFSFRFGVLLEDYFSFSPVTFHCSSYFIHDEDQTEFY
jgi:hypothetical protein